MIAAAAITTAAVKIGDVGATAKKHRPHKANEINPLT